MLLSSGAVARDRAPVAEQLRFELLKFEGRTARWKPERLGRDVTLRYAIVTRETAIDSAINCDRIRPPENLLRKSGLNRSDFSVAVRRAFDVWQSLDTPAFHETLIQEEADILIGEQAVPVGLAFTNLSFDKLAPHSIGPVAGISSGQICLNPEKSWKIGFDGNFARPDIVFAVAHEIGHVLGLDHPSARGHLMSFKYLEDRLLPSVGDMAGIHALYGGTRANRAAVDDAAPALEVTSR